MIIKPLKTKLFKEGEDLPRFIYGHIPSLKDGSVLVISSKIVSLSEGRTAAIMSSVDAEGKAKILRFLSQSRLVTPLKRDRLLGRPVRKATYDCVSCLNRRHMLFAWCSLFSVGFADLYVRLCSMGIWQDWTIL